VKFETCTAVQTNLLTLSSCNQAVGSSETSELELNYEYMASHFGRRDITTLCIGVIPLFFPQSSVRVLNDFQSTQSFFSPRNNMKSVVCVSG
jgi:hypothetical protein